jgi:crotonobetainyl-CoA:carnitine CoA-transferase CaiB-like acyl-CoA transferase
MAVEVEHPSRGKVRLVGEPIVLSRTPAQVAAPLLELGAHSEEILREAGYSDADITRLRQAKVV